MIKKILLKLLKIPSQSNDSDYIISDNTLLIKNILSEYGVDIDNSRIRTKGNDIKLIVGKNYSENKTVILERLKQKLPNFNFLFIQESDGLQAQSNHTPSNYTQAHTKSMKKYPHSPQGSIRPASIKNILVVASGKGGVGKSIISLNLARSLQSKGLKVAFIDCDIHGPSSPVMTGGYEKAIYKDDKLQPIMRDNLKTMSIGYMIDPSRPVIWRGPMVSGAITQIFQETDWGDIDVAVVDMPPGTGDAQLTICQNLSPDGAIIISQPQMVSVIDAERCALMFEHLKIPIWGVIENMSGFIAPDTGKAYYIFGEGGAKSFAQAHNYHFLGALPIVPMMAYCSDQGINPLSNDDCVPFMHPLLDIADYIRFNNLKLFEAL